MIRYTLDCKKGHTFDGWFADSAGFDKQAKRGLVVCPECGGNKVTKALMAPRVATSKQRDKARSEIRSRVAAQAAAVVSSDAEPSTAMTAGLTSEQQQVLGLMRKLRREVEANSENVGTKFAEEARKIHYEEAPARGIYGEASKDEVEALHAEGVACFPLPVLPEDKN
jgi:hypothetical protein